MNNNNMSLMDIKSMNAGALAYMGDAIFEVFVRQHIMTTNYGGNLHKKAKAYVSAKGQSQTYHKLMTIATEEEKTILKRGRNHVTKAPKSATMSEYRHATGIEALFGFLY
jgi:ribonuclease-3 family protein